MHVRAMVFGFVGLASAALTGCAALPGTVPASRPASDAFRARAGGFKVLHVFGHGTDGASPQGELIDVSGTFLATTSAGGTNEKGTMFAITAAGTERVLHNFGGTGDGVNPQSAMIVHGNALYGTTLFGGGKALGTVFSIGADGSNERVLHSLAGKADGSAPRAALTELNGTFYGTAQQDGSHQAGVVFAITSSGAERIVHEFDPARGDGGTPSARLIAVGGTLYGTTQVGGKHGAGTVFSMSSTGAVHVLYSFFGGNDGEDPYAGLTYVNGKLYGTTFEGGTMGNGTVFAVTTGGAETIVHSFGTIAHDGGAPEAGLIAVNGTLYGTTSGGGSAGEGTVFKMTPSGGVTVLHSFSGSDGSSPVAGLTFANGLLYGVASHGGRFSGGTVFAQSL